MIQFNYDITLDNYSFPAYLVRDYDLFPEINSGTVGQPDGYKPVIAIVNIDGNIVSSDRVVTYDLGTKAFPAPKYDIVDVGNTPLKLVKKNGYINTNASIEFDIYGATVEAINARSNYVMSVLASPACAVYQAVDDSTYLNKVPGLYIFEIESFQFNFFGRVTKNRIKYGTINVNAKCINNAIVLDNSGGIRRISSA